MEEQHSVSKGQNVMLSCFSLEDTKTNFVYRIVCEIYFTVIDMHAMYKCVKSKNGEIKAQR